MVGEYRHAVTTDIVNSILVEPFSRMYAEKMRIHHKPTIDHSVRVALLATDMALDANIPLYQAYWVAYGAFFHDAGKLKVDADILWKPTKLDEDEWKIIRNHPRLGFQYLMKHGKPIAASFAISHHEYKQDPYPRKLDLNVFADKRSQHFIEKLFPLVALADAHDAMSVQRSYNPSFSKKEIGRRLIQSYRGPKKPLTTILARC